MLNREELEGLERKNLKPYACLSETAQRNAEVGKHPLRTEFQRDRDRIIHSKAFRRLEYKTQVFLTRKGDHLRTRLTHSLEVAQIGRTVAVQLGLNSDLVEAISLGHDLGHTPFGHVGEKVLRKLLKDSGVNTFKHNVQSVRILECLEKKYPYEGLRLTIPVLEGVLKHTGLPTELPAYCNNLYIDRAFSITLEGQVVAIADEIAQITHDMDDYLRYNIISLNDFLKHELFKEVFCFFKEVYGSDFNSIINEIAQEDRKKDTIIRCMVDYLVVTLIKQSAQSLDDTIKSYQLDRVYIDFTEPSKTIIGKFQKYLSNMLLNDYRIKEMDRRGEDIVTTLFSYYKDNPQRLPNGTYELYKQNGIIVIGDYISGMTDRYALEQYDELIDLG